MTAESAIFARRRPCPVCSRTRSKHLYTQSFEQLSSITPVRGYDVVVCESCGAGFADGVPSQEVFDAYYRDASKYEHGAHEGKESASDEQRFRDMTADILGFIADRNARVLEIGCATGRLLSLLRDTGIPNVLGLDPSPGCAAAAKRLYGIPVRTGTIFDIPAEARGCGIVIIGGVLEHLENVGGAALAIRQALNECGRVYVEVPDASRLAGRPDAPFQEFSTEHINFFGPISLRNVFERNGFSTVSIRRAMRAQTENTNCPTVFGVFEKSDGPAAPISYDDESEIGLRRYIGEGMSGDTRLRTVISEHANERSVIVWGAGAHTQRLLACGAFDKVVISAFVDSNPKYRGQQLRGIPVLGPSEIRSRIEPILISTRGFQREIQDQIRNDLNMQNELILLYDE